MVLSPKDSFDLLTKMVTIPMTLTKTRMVTIPMTLTKTRMVTIPNMVKMPLRMVTIL